MVTTEDKETLWQLESDEEFLNRIYESELGRAPDGEGFKYWLDDMNIRGETREQVLDGQKNIKVSTQKNKV